MKCPKCDSRETHKFGKTYSKQGPRQRHQCKACGHTFNEKTTIIQKAIKKEDEQE